MPSCGHCPTSTLRDRGFMSAFNLSYRKRAFLNVIVLQYNMRKKRDTKPSGNEGTLLS